MHWLILIALVAAVVYGTVFHTTYQIQVHSYKMLNRLKVNQETIELLVSLKGERYSSLASFDAALRELLPEQDYGLYYSAIIKAAYDNTPVSALSWLGDLFLRALKMIIIPLILSSLISGVSGIGSGSSLGRLGLKTFTYYILTSIIAILTGLLLVNIIKPGVGTELNFSAKMEGLVENQPTLRQTLLSIIPENIFNAFTENQMLAIIFFAILFGFFITRISDEYREILVKAFNAIFEVMMKITIFVIRFAPLGIFGLVIRLVADQDDLLNLVTRLGFFILTVISGLVFHFFITLPLIVRFIGKARPYKHMSNMSTPLLTAFSTASSGATLPLTMDAVENNSGVSNKISSFVLPLGATVNMDGTALYECVGAMFIAQAYGLEMNMVQQFIIIITALLASIGAAGVPMAGMVMMALVLTAVGLPLEGVGLILAVDPLLDMSRTAVNVWSDSCGTVVIAKSEGEALKV